MDWPRRKILERAIDNDPAAVLQWLSDNLTRTQCIAFADTISPVDDELRAARLAQAVDIIDAYGPAEMVTAVKESLTIEITRLKPVEIDGATVRK